MPYYEEFIWEFILEKREEIKQGIKSGSIIDVLSDIFAKNQPSKRLNDLSFNINIDKDSSDKAHDELVEHSIFRIDPNRRTIDRNHICDFMCGGVYALESLIIHPSMILTEIFIDRIEDMKIFSYDCYINENFRTAFDNGYVKNRILLDIKKYYRDFKYWGYFLTSLAKYYEGMNEEESVLFSEGLVDLEFKWSLNTMVFPFKNENPVVTIDSEIFVNDDGKYDFKKDSSSDKDVLLSKNFKIDFKSMLSRN